MMLDGMKKFRFRGWSNHKTQPGKQTYYGEGLFTEGKVYSAVSVDEHTLLGEFQEEPDVLIFDDRFNEEKEHNYPFWEHLAYFDEVE